MPSPGIPPRNLLTTWSFSPHQAPPGLRNHCSPNRLRTVLCLSPMRLLVAEPFGPGSCLSNPSLLASFPASGQLTHTSRGRAAWSKTASVAATMLPLATSLVEMCSSHRRALPLPGTRLGPCTAGPQCPSRYPGHRCICVCTNRYAVL